MRITFTLIAAIIALAGLAVSSRADSVTIQTASGTLGADFGVSNDATAGIQYITVLTPSVNDVYPGTNSRVATYTVTFPSAGTYDLYAEVEVGTAGFNADSLFYASSFGVQSPTTAANWVKINNLALSGFTNSTDIVSGVGSLGYSYWKWVNLSQLTNGDGGTPLTFNVPAGNLTQTFQIGGRETGLQIAELVFGTATNSFTVAQLEAGSGGSNGPPPIVIVPADLVGGNLVQFDDNGIWTWYSDERTVIDTNENKIVAGCVENGSGLGGIPRDGNINVTVWDVQSGTGPRYTLRTNLTSFGGGDDHNAPGLLVMSNGHYLAMYTGHNQDSNTWFRVFDPATTTWSPETNFNWASQPGGTDFNTTYSNPNNMSAEGRTYDFARGNGHGSQNIIVSTDYGTNWTYGGMLTSNNIPGYVEGYFKYWGNGVDRIDFICTEAHPRDYDTSIYHGFVSNGMNFNTYGTVMDTNIFDKLNMAQPQDFTPVFTAGTVEPPGQTNYRCWDDDICRYADGAIECIITARINDNTEDNDANINPDHAFFFCRFDGTNWNSTYLCQAGYKLYSTEADYVGLGCLNPNDPNTIYISTEFDPRAVIPGVTDTNLAYTTVHEIWKGVTTNQGVSFAWTPITQGSLRDNLRPVMPIWDNTDSALLWFRAVYTSAQIVDGAIVGIVEHRNQVVGQMHYVDATAGAGGNTSFTNGATLVLSGAMNQWHSQTGVGNGATIISSADSVAEHATNIMTQVTLPGPGTYDVWVNFWGNPAADWRIAAGLVPANMQVYRSEKCQRVQAWTEDTTVVLTNANPVSNYLYQAYVGRLDVSTNLAVNIYVGDWPYQTGATNLVGDTCRAWYDGVSYAKVQPFQIQSVSPNGSYSVSLVWNSPPPEMSLTTPTYTLQKTASLVPPISWTTVATGIPATSEAYATTNIDKSANGSAAFYRVTWP